VLTQTAAAQAKAGQAGPLAQAQAQQEVTLRQTELAKLEAARKQQELLTSTVRPAEAEAEAVVRRAEGDKSARIAAAQADAERQKLAGQAEAAVIQVKGEAQAKVVEVNAKAEAQRVTLEGNAEAGITFTKGEAEAKALALRAEAFQKFNEAAIIQTVLGMLPDIVRAAAEPMSAIDNLTVLSNDGASELVRNTTRTVTEASATVKGLTGLDVPALISNAMGGTFNGGNRGRGSTQGGGGGPARQPKRETPTVPHPPAAASSQPAAAASQPAAAASTPIQTMGQAEAAISRASETISRAAAQTLPAARPPNVGSASALPRITSEMPVSEAAALLAAQMRRIPGIERHLTIPLAELDQRGPRPVRAAWRLARDRVADSYGGMTVGELLSRFGDTGGGSRRPDDPSLTV
jgi:hypothetical protein